jgi:hypothetical protein
MKKRFSTHFLTLTTLAIVSYAMGAHAEMNSTLYGEGFDQSGNRIVTAWVWENPDIRETYFRLEYWERRNGVVRPCVEPRTPVYAVLTTGPQHHRTSIVLPMQSLCHPDFRDAFYTPGRAYLTVMASYSGIWDRLFPLREDGSRWYAIQVAFTTRPQTTDPEASWDSNWNNDYRIVLK